VDFDHGLLVDGVNTIAAELHQSAPTTSDAAFDLAMEFVVATDPVVTYTLTASNQFGSTTATVDARTIPVPTDPIYLSNSNADDVGWTFPEVWSDRSAPHAGRYIAYGQFDSVIRTPVDDPDPSFAGTSIELLGASTQLILAHRSGTARVATIILGGGRIVNGVGRDLALGRGGDSLLIASDSTIGTNNNSGAITISSNLIGSGAVRVRNSTGGAAIFTGDNSGFSGLWQIDNEFAPAARDAIGSGPIVISDTGTLDPGIDFLTPLPNTLSISTAATLKLDQTMVFGSGLVSIDGNDLPDGGYSATDLEVLGFGGIFIDGGARLFIGAAGPDADGDGLLDSWELSYFDDLGDTDGSGDADGDGQTDGAEFAAMTSPVDAGDVLKITSMIQGAAGDVTLTWPSKAAVSYGVRFGDLSSWINIANGLAGTGSEMSFTDDGSLSGGLPGADDERHYQVFVE
jgi:hypothetical protein